MHKPLRTIFYVESALTLLTAIYCLLLPARFIAMFAAEPAGAIAEAFIRWYGVTLIVIVYVLFRALRNGSLEALRPVLQGLLIGDVLHLAVTWMLADAVGGWNQAIIATVITTVFFGGARIYALWARPDLLAALHPASWNRGKHHESP